jgi:replicative DNA helicase
MLHLLDVDSLEELARDGLPEDMIPTEHFRPIVRWAVEYWHRSGRTKAPSLSALRTEQDWAHTLDDHELPLGDQEPEDSIEWAISDLRSSYAHLEAQRLLKQAATALAEAEIGDIPSVVDEFADEVVSLSIKMTPRDQMSDVRASGASERLLAYEERAESQQTLYGLRFGFDAVDNHTFGIHEGELAIVSAGPKVGKSYVAALSALAEWEAGQVPALYTLENSVDMTIDRIACYKCGVDPIDWQHGTCSPDEVEKVRFWISELQKKDHPLYVLQPDLGKRSFASMVRQAQILDADSVLIDQLTFVELDGDPRQPKHERIGISLHMLKGMISTGRKNISALLTHQINRDGVRYAMKNGHHTLLDLAESAECERTADWIFSIYRSGEHQRTNAALLQVLAARRAPIKWWEMDWDLKVGNIDVRSEMTVAV